MRERERVRGGEERERGGVVCSRHGCGLRRGKPGGPTGLVCSRHLGEHSTADSADRLGAVLCPDHRLRGRLTGRGLHKRCWVAAHGSRTQMSPGTLVHANDPDKSANDIEFLVCQPVYLGQTGLGIFPQRWPPSVPRLAPTMLHLHLLFVARDPRRAHSA